NVKAYLRCGAARESLLRYTEALEDFKHAQVLLLNFTPADRRLIKGYVVASD
ncbi:hypothetical protein S245_017156, partial [Arachis hypogaea]